MTFRQSLNRSVVHTFWWVSILAYALAYGNLTNEHTVAERPPVKESVSYLIQFCKAPVDGAYPSKALVRDTGGGARYVKGRKAVDKAILDAMGEKDWKGVTAISFCK